VRTVGWQCRPKILRMFAVAPSARRTCRYVFAWTPKVAENLPNLVRLGAILLSS
jgi:hypothetical protein